MPTPRSEEVEHMESENSHRSALYWKIPMAVALIGAVVVLAARDIAPRVPVVEVLVVYCLAAVALLAILMAWAAIGSAWHRYGLNHGARDPASLWFGDEPPGLQRLRREHEPDDADGRKEV
jgi:hypothetical protein